MKMAFFIFAESGGSTFTVRPWEQRGGWGDVGKISFTMMWPCIVTVAGAHGRRRGSHPAVTVFNEAIPSALFLEQSR